MEQDYTIFFSSDVHGSEKCWMKFVNAAKFYGAQALVMGGDITATSELGKGSCFTMTLPTVCPTAGALVHDEADLAELDPDGAALKPAA